MQYIANKLGPTAVPETEANEQRLVSLQAPVRRPKEVQARVLQG